AFVHIVDGVGLSCDDVKIRLQPYARHADWFFDAVFVVDHVVLRHYMDNLASRRNHHPVHVLGKTLDIAYRDLIILRGAGNDAVLNKTADMLTGNPHVNYPDINTRLITRFFDSLLHGINGFVNIKANALHHSFRFRFTRSEHLKFTEFILPADDDTYFRGSDIEADYNFFLFHDVVLFIVVVLMSYAC